eukprot:12792989-Alexandrium_andersonii.AAC.1
MRPTSRVARCLWLTRSPVGAILCAGGVAACGSSGESLKAAFAVVGDLGSDRVPGQIPRRSGVLVVEQG